MFGTKLSKKILKKTKILIFKTKKNLKIFKTPKNKLHVLTALYGQVKDDQEVLCVIAIAQYELTKL